MVSRNEAPRLLVSSLAKVFRFARHRVFTPSEDPVTLTNVSGAEMASSKHVPNIRGQTHYIRRCLSA
jgi:hypothetical protein